MTQCEISLKVLLIKQLDPLSALSALSLKRSVKLFLPAKSKAGAYLIVILGIPVAISVIFYVAPPLDVLPNPKQKTIDVYISTYESLSMSAVETEIAQVIEQRTRQEKNQGTAPEYRNHGMLCVTYSLTLMMLSILLALKAGFMKISPKILSVQMLI